MRWCSTLLVLVACLSSVRAEEPAEAWRRHFAERLAAAAFDQPVPRAYDVTMYRTEFYAPRSEEEIRAIVVETYDRTDAVGAHKKGSPERQTEIDAEVQRILKEQEERKPQRTWMRVRIAGESIRIDRTILKPDEEFRPDMRVEDTFINANGQHIWYHHVPGSASASIHPAARPWTRSRKDFEDWFVAPQVVRSNATLLLGKMDKTDAAGRATLDPGKMDSFIRNGSNVFRVSLSTEGGPGGRAVDRVEIDLAPAATRPTETGRIVFTCDRDDYARVHEVLFYKGGKLVEEHRYEGRDTRGIPRRIKMQTHDAGSVRPGSAIQRDIVIVRAAIDPVLSDEVFAWKPPATYLITDGRQGEPKVYRQPEEQDPG